MGFKELRFRWQGAKTKGIWQPLTFSTLADGTMYYFTIRAANRILAKQGVD